MTDDERKAWEENLEDCRLYIGEYGPDRRCTSILAADAELKRLREAVEWAHERFFRQHDRDGWVTMQNVLNRAT